MKPKSYKNIKEAHEKLNYPGSYRVGTLIKNNIVLRIYSNSKIAHDYFSKNSTEFNYVIKSDKIYNAFINTKKTNQLVDVFKKDLETNSVKYYGKYRIKGFRENKKYVLLALSK